MALEGMQDDDLLFCPLGGSNEIGMNMNLFGCRGHWLMIDCGMSFADDWLPGIDLIFPDPGFIAERHEDLVALVLTHGHEDHIGAVPYLWPRLRCPIYATPFTAELVRGKLAEAGLAEVARVHEVPIAGSLEAGPFHVTYVPLAHSIPEGHGLKIETPQGVIFHTGDWKLDAEPQIGAPSTPEELTAIGDAGVLAMIGDSTNVFQAHSSGSEQAVKEGLHEIVKNLEGRVIVTTFASNVARLKTIAELARQEGRRLVLIGRSMKRVVAAAQKTGYLGDLPELVPEEEAGSLPRGQVLVLCTGAQGEPRAALSRLASGSYRHFALEPGDTVIFSSKIIPGNELSIGRLVNRLALADVEVITEREAFVHVSGHPGREDLEKMYRWIRPRIAIPVHGEPRHLKRHARFARALGVPEAVAPQNGDIIRLAPGPAAVVDQAPAGRLALDGSHIVPVTSEAITARRRILSDGFAAIVVMIDADGSLPGDPEIVAYGIPTLEPGSVFEDELLDLLERTIARMDPAARGRDAELGETLRVAARRLLRRRTEKNPVVDVRIVRFEEEAVA
ncbi:MAG: ribonuclease J, partial [Rhodothalassiaceae bacterium]